MRQLWKPAQPHRPDQPQVQADWHHSSAEDHQAHFLGPAQAVTPAASLHHRGFQQRRLEQQLCAGLNRAPAVMSVVVGGASGGGGSVLSYCYCYTCQVL